MEFEYWNSHFCRGISENVIWIFPLSPAPARPDLSASHGLLRNLYLLRLKGNSLATAWKNNNQCISRKEARERKVVV